MSIVDRLTARGYGKPEHDPESKARHDALYSRIRAGNPNLAPENIDLSDVDFTKTDAETRAAIAAELGITAQERIDAIDLDAIISPSGEHRRRVRRAYKRQQEAKRDRGRARFARQQRLARAAEPQPGNHDKILAARAAKAEREAQASLNRPRP